VIHFVTNNCKKKKIETKVTLYVY